MNTITTIIAGAALTFGAGIALGQSPTPPPADQEAAPAPEATTGPADSETDAHTTDANAVDASATGADAAAAGAVVAGSAGAAAAASAEADATDEPLSEEELAQKKRAEAKAKRKAACLAINVGKPRDC
jgi:hypothetical protein